MVTVIVLFSVWAVCRVLGWVGVEVLDSWAASARVGLAAMFLVTGIGHFTKMRHDFAKMVPPVFAEPLAIVYFTGVCEILGAAGILIPGTRRIAGICLAVLLAALLPANIKAAREGIPLAGRMPTPLPQRILMQAIFIAVALWSTLPDR